MLRPSSLHIVIQIPQHLRHWSAPGSSRDFELEGGVYLIRQHSLVIQVLRKPSYNLDLLLYCQPNNRLLDQSSHARLINRDKALIVHEREESHDELAIHPVSNTTMPGNSVAEILDLEGPLETRCEESAEGRDERCKGRQEDNVQLHWGEVECSRDEWEG